MSDREQSRSGGCYQESGRRQKVAAGATESSDKGGGKLRTVLVLLHSTTAVVLQGKMAQHTCSPSHVVIGVAAREQDGESWRHVVALMCETIWVDSV